MRRIRVALGLAAEVTPSCTVLTVVETRGRIHNRGYIDRDAKEHDSYQAAIEYLRTDLDLRSGYWDRIYIVNATKEADRAIEQQQGSS